MIMGLNEIQYLLPNFDFEWNEAKRYINHNDLNKRILWDRKKWIELSSKGEIIELSKILDLQNVSNINDFDSLNKDKISRFNINLRTGIIELPIVCKFSNGIYELISGNTRIIGLIKNGYNPMVWLFKITASRLV